MRWNDIGKRIAAAVLLSLTFFLAGCSSQVADGTALLEEQDYEGAREAFQQAVEDGENLGEAYRGLGICYWEQEDYENALEAFENALDNGTEATATLYNMMGLCELNAGTANRAAYYFENGQKKEGASAELLQEMAFNEIIAYEKAGDYETARYRLEDYVEDYPEDTRAAKELEFLNTQAPESEAE